MQVIGTNPLRDPFVGSGSLQLNDRITDNLKRMPLALVVERINALDAGVVASINDAKCLVLDSPDDFTIYGHQDVLDTFGVVSEAMKA